MCENNERHSQNVAEGTISVDRVCSDNNHCDKCSERATVGGVMPMALPSSVIDTFSIPDEMARELNTLIPRVAVLRDLMLSAIDTPTRFDALEAKVLPLQDRYMTIKNMITYTYVPEKYRTTEYSWNYPGYDISTNVCWIEHV